MNERLKDIRKTLGLNQNELGSKVNLSRSHISSLENGTRELTDRLIADYCREFNVNENWLRTGEGEMFIESNSTIIAELAGEYRLDAIDQKIIEHYVKMDAEDRQKIKDHVVSLANEITSKEETAATIDNDRYIEEELDRTRLELEAEKKGETSSVLGVTGDKNLG